MSLELKCQEPQGGAQSIKRTGRQEAKKLQNKRHNTVFCFERVTSATQEKNSGHNRRTVCVVTAGGCQHTAESVCVYVTIPAKII